MTLEHVDVLIAGAGISGIGAGYHLQDKCPGRTYAIFESREDIGGTWDLFRYPGIRSDSDMYTFGYSFRPWTHADAISDGASIKEYLRETAKAYGIDRHIRFGHRVRCASWSSSDAQWTVEVERGDDNEPVRLTCNFLFMCTGYYNYAEGYTPNFAGTERFAGRIVHPQKWTDDIDYAGKRVILIGSGATAVTLLPALAEQAAHVTMLQRSPTYIISLPSRDRVANFLRRVLPGRVAHRLTRWKNVLLSTWASWLCRHYPERVRSFFIEGARKQLGPDYDVATHFTPRYNPWDQRVCVAPDGDFFKTIKSGRASVVTDEIETFTENGLQLASGVELEADLIVTATGLDLQFMSDLQVTVDGEPVDLTTTIMYKGMMFSGVPNLALSTGYTNASWTLKVDLSCAYLCRLLNHMAKTRMQTCTPRLNDPSTTPVAWVGLSSGYVLRSLHKFPKQGSKKPWRLHQNYFLDSLALRFGAVDDGTLEFSAPPR